MSFYNPYPSFPLQLPIPVTLASSYFSYPNPKLANINPYLMASAFSSNYIPPKNLALNDFDSPTYGVIKKRKLDYNEQKVFPSNFSETSDISNSACKKSPNKIINLEEDEDCLIIYDSSTKNSQVSQSSTTIPPSCYNLNLQNSFDQQAKLLSQPSLKLIDFKFSNILNPSDVVLMQLWQQAQMNNFIQQPLQRKIDILASERHYQETTQTFPSSNNLNGKQISPNSEVILIQDEDDDNSQPSCYKIFQDTKQFKYKATYQQKVNIQNSTTSVSKPQESLEIKRESKSQQYKIFNEQHRQYSSIDPTKNQGNEEIIPSKIVDISENFAKLPPFELGRSCNKRKNHRKPKLIWSQDSVKSYSFEKGLEQIEKVIGMQITDEEKVAKTLKKYNNNIEIALNMIKRHKAQYKSYFRVQKIERVHKPYFKSSI